MLLSCCRALHRRLSSGSPALWSTTVGVGGTSGCALLLRTRTWHPFAPPCRKSPAMAISSPSISLSDESDTVAMSLGCPFSDLRARSCGAVCARCVALVASRPSHGRWPTVAASFRARGFQTRRARFNRDRLMRHRRSAFAGSTRARARFAGWTWAVRSRINGLGSSTSILKLGFPERIIYELKKVINFQNA